MRSLVIISHTEHYHKNNGEIVGWEPTIREINNLTHIFDQIYHVAPLYNKFPHQANAPYSSNRIKFIPIKPTGGIGLIKKVQILFNIPLIIFTIIKVINKSDYIHFRAPTNLGIFVLPLMLFYRKKKGWIKYAGNWKQKKVPLSYSIQRWWLSKNYNKSKVTINGKWNDQKQHLITFLNPCWNEEELSMANIIGQNKDYSQDLNVCFVGRLDLNKGINRILKAINDIGKMKKIKSIDIVGGDYDYDKNSLIINNIKTNYWGWINRDKLNHIYEKSHIIILPSQSEGFPKVIAEAAAFGCIPIVTNIFPINQLILHEVNGLLLDNPSSEKIRECILKVDKGAFKLKDISKSTMKLSNQFTYRHYINRIEEEIINV